MNKIKLIIYERFDGKQSLEDVFVSAFQTEFIQLMQDKMSGIIEQSQDSFCSGKDRENVSIGIQKSLVNKMTSAVGKLISSISKGIKSLFNGGKI